MADFAYCVDCHELSYAITDKNGVFDRNSASPNHWNHRNIIFHRPPEHYVAPVRNILTKLGVGAPISSAEIMIFKTALEVAEDPDLKVFERNLLNPRIYSSTIQS